MNKRILFVDDNPALLEAHTLMVIGEEGWEVEGVSGGKEALKRMESAAFDVVVSDYEMPGMDGVALIKEVMQRYPDMARVIVSGLADQERIAQSLCETHQFLAKPLNPKLLKSTLARICGLDQYLRDDQLRKLVMKLGTVPSFPSAYIEIMQELTAREPSIEKIADFVAKDPGMTAKLLQIANSAAMGLSHTVTTPMEAIQYVGMGTMRSVALSAHVLERFEREPVDGFSITKLWEHALRSAALARMILRQARVEPADADDAYIAAMLHDIGELMLAYNQPDEFRKAADMARERKIPFWQAEQEVFGADHAGVGAYLLGLWGLPAPVVEAVAFHHSPLRSETRTLGPLAAVHIASTLEHELGNGDPSSPPWEMSEEYVASLGVESRMPAWRVLAEKICQPQSN